MDLSCLFSKESLGPTVLTVLIEPMLYRACWGAEVYHCSYKYVNDSSFVINDAVFSVVAIESFVSE